MLLCHPSISPVTALLSPQDTFWRYNSADWDGFRDLLATYPRMTCFTSDVFSFTGILFQLTNFLSRAFLNQANLNTPSGLITNAIVLYA